MKGESSGSRRRVRATYAGLLGVGLVGAGALVGSRLAAPSSSAKVLDTAVVAAEPTASSVTTSSSAAPSGTLPPVTLEPTTSTSTSTSSSTDTTTVTANRAAGRGDCVDDRRGDEELVSCDAPHTREIVAVLDAAGLQRELGTTTRPEPRSPQQVALDAYCEAQLATYLPRPLASNGRFRPVQWLIVPEAWARDPRVECVIQEFEVTATQGLSRVARTGRLRTDLPADQSLEIPSGACLDVGADQFHIVACPAGNAVALGSVDWPTSNDSGEVQAACTTLLPPGQEGAVERLRFGRPSDPDLAAGARRTVCFLGGSS